MYHVILTFEVILLLPESYENVDISFQIFLFVVFVQSFNLVLIMQHKTSSNLLNPWGGTEDIRCIDQGNVLWFWPLVLAILPLRQEVHLHAFITQ